MSHVLTTMQTAGVVRRVFIKTTRKIYAGKEVAKNIIWIKKLFVECICGVHENDHHVDEINSMPANQLRRHDLEFNQKNQEQIVITQQEHIEAVPVTLPPQTPLEEE